MADGSFEEFYDATYHRLLRQLVLVTGDRGDAEDLLQDAYGRAAVSWRRLRDYQAPEAWVRRIALRLAIDRARRTRRRAAALLRLRPPRSPSSELSADSLDLYNALRGLPASQRQAVVLHHLVGLPVEEIASQLNVPGECGSRRSRQVPSPAGHQRFGLVAAGGMTKRMTDAIPLCSGSHGPMRPVRRPPDHPISAHQPWRPGCVPYLDG